VTHVIWQPGKSFALVEFGSDALADLAFQLCKMKPDSVRLAQQRLLVERPAAPKPQPNGAASSGSNGADLGLHVKVITVVCGMCPFPEVGLETLFFLLHGVDLGLHVKKFGFYFLVFMAIRFEAVSRLAKMFHERKAVS
jgi:hypothetical protein